MQIRCDPFPLLSSGSGLGNKIQLDCGTNLTYKENFELWK